LQLQKPSKLFISAHSKALSVAMSGQRSRSFALGAALRTGRTPAGFLEIVGDYFPILQRSQRLVIVQTATLHVAK